MDLRVENPATGAVITTVPVSEAAEVSEMAARARAAQRGWLALGFAGRAAVMRRAQRWMADNATRVIGAVVGETGKTYEDAQLTDFGYIIQALGFWAKTAEGYLADERLHYWGNPIVAGKKLVLRYQPVGVVGVIGPWNFPLVNGFGDCIPALMAGNGVILKPSEVTPLSSLLMAEMFVACGMPQDVFQVAIGGGETGASLVAAVDCVMFTGSTGTGRLVAQAAAEALIPCHLELGGNDPMIVCADADLERAANAAAYYSMNNAGQVCISVERAYVEAPVMTTSHSVWPRRSSRLRQGPPAGPGSVDVGAVIFATAAGDHRSRTCRMRLPRARGFSRAGIHGPRAAGASTSRPCSSTSITRWRSCARRPSARRCRSCASRMRTRRFGLRMTLRTGCRRASGRGIAAVASRSLDDSKRASSASTPRRSTTTH